MRTAARAALAAALALGALGASAQAYRITDRIAGPDGGWDLASVDPVAHRLYVARSDAEMAVDLRSGAVTNARGPTQRGHAALAIPRTHDVISTNGTSNNATIFNGLTGKVRATIATGIKPDAVVYDPATRTLWIMNPGSGDITVVEPRSARVVATVAVGGSLELGATDGRGLLFVNVEDKNEVAVIDTRARKVVRRFPLKGCDGPTGIAYAPDSNLMVSACANGVAIVSRRDGTLVASLPIGPRPDGALYDPRRHVALIPSGGDGTLAGIQLSGSPHVVERIAPAKGARTAALDPTTGRVYLPSADFSPPIGNERPTILPGPFRVLAVSP